jgi:hypothetical protein
LFKKFGLIHQILTFVKDEGNNLASMATTWHSIIDCELLNLPQVYEGICFSHVLSKTCQYSMNDNKVSMGLRQVSVKDAQTSYIIQSLGQKNLRKGGKNGRKLVLKVGCHFTSSKHLSKQGLQEKYYV